MQDETAKDNYQTAALISCGLMIRNRSELAFLLGFFLAIPGPGVICGLSLLLVLVLAPRVFLRVLPQKSTLLNSNSIWKQWMKSHFVEMPLQIPIYYLFIIIILLLREIFGFPQTNTSHLILSVQKPNYQIDLKVRANCEYLQRYRFVSWLKVSQLQKNVDRKAPIKAN